MQAYIMKMYDTLSGSVLRACVYLALQAWVDINAGSLRLRAMYGVRLYRRTPDRSRT